jgi:hypothetical protein
MNDLAINSCLICYLPTNNILSCNCIICSDCLYEWIIYKNYSSLYKEESILICPNHKCKTELGLHFLNNTFINKQLRAINEILLRKYTNTNTDIHKCPNNFCNYIGWYDNSKKCSNNLICELCNYQWYPPAITKYQLLFNLRVAVNQCKDYFLNYIPSIIRILCTTKPCPGCGIYIENHINHCISIKCELCETVFCYLCPKSTHILDIDDLLCNLKDVFSILFVIFMFFMLFLKFATSVIDIYIVTIVFMNWLGANIMLCIELIPVSLLCLAFVFRNQLYDRVRLPDGERVKKFNKCILVAIILLCSIFLLIIIYHVYLYKTNSEVRLWTNVLICQNLIIALVTCLKYCYEYFV